MTPGPLTNFGPGPLCAPGFRPGGGRQARTKSEYPERMSNAAEPLAVTIRPGPICILAIRGGNTKGKEP